MPQTCILSCKKSTHGFLNAPPPLQWLCCMQSIFLHKGVYKSWKLNLNVYFGAAKTWIVVGGYAVHAALTNGTYTQSSTNPCAWPDITAEPGRRPSSHCSVLLSGTNRIKQKSGAFVPMLAMVAASEVYIRKQSCLPPNGSAVPQRFYFIDWQTEVRKHGGSTR